MWPLAILRALSGCCAARGAATSNAVIMCIAFIWAVSVSGFALDTLHPGILFRLPPVSELLDAIAGVPNACEPVPGLVAGGQPQPRHITALKQAGCELVVDCRDPMEPRPLREPEAVGQAGLEYVCIPVGRGRGS